MVLKVRLQGDLEWSPAARPASWPPVPGIRVVRRHGTVLLSSSGRPCGAPPERTCAPLPGLLCKPIGLRHPGGGEANAGTLWADLALTFMPEFDQDVSRPTPGTALVGYPLTADPGRWGTSGMGRTLPGTPGGTPRQVAKCPRTTHVRHRTAGFRYAGRRYMLPRSRGRKQRPWKKPLDLGFPSVETSQGPAGVGEDQGEARIEWCDASCRKPT